MRILFIHQNCPGQYKHLARVLAEKPENEVVFITKPGKPDIAGARKVEYRLHREPSKETHPYVATMESAVLHGQAVARVAMDLKSKGFEPDIICAHVGWGEALYVKDIWPKTPLLGYFEFYYHAFGADVHFDPDEEIKIDKICRVHTRNAHHLLSLEAADYGISPTHWQRQQFPSAYRDKISVIHEGVDTAAITPDPDAQLTLPNGETLHAGDKVVTYVARNLEPYRGFPEFMRAAELILKRHPESQIVVVGGDEVSYGAAPSDGKSYRELMLQQLDLDLSRIHFLGRVPYATFLQVLQISVAHIYLTVPFVLSWSMLEAMAAECLVIGSRTAPVTEVIKDGDNGLLADFFSPQAIADRVDEVFSEPERMEGIRKRARRTVVQYYELHDCLKKHEKLIKKIIGTVDRVSGNVVPRLQPRRKQTRGRKRRHR